MAVKVGSARIDENGKACGGAAGDQTGKEVSAQSWYLHSKGWRVFRAKDPAIGARMAAQMLAACGNPCIGYDQWQRHTLYKAAKAAGWDIGKVKTRCETDCSALIRVILAGVGVFVPEDFRTGNMPKYLLGTGKFTELKDGRYTTKSDYLRRGDILVTKTSGHTVMVVSDGPKAGDSAPGEGLRRGDRGADVTAMQRGLVAWDGKCLPKYGADGDFGGETEAAVKAFQASAGLPVTGVYDAATAAKLKAIGAPKAVKVTGNLVNVRSAPGTTSKILGVVRKGEVLEYQGESRDVGGTPWYLVAYRGQNGWISGKFGRLME